MVGIRLVKGLLHAAGRSYAHDLQAVCMASAGEGVGYRCACEREHTNFGARFQHSTVVQACCIPIDLVLLANTCYVCCERFTLQDGMGIWYLCCCPFCISCLVAGGHQKGGYASNSRTPLRALRGQLVVFTLALRLRIRDAGGLMTVILW